MSLSGLLRKNVLIVFLVSPAISSGQAITPEDFERYKIEAAKGDAEATYHLGRAYSGNYGVAELDLEKGNALIKTAAELGYVEAQRHYGQNLYYGYGRMEKNYEEAVYWYGLAAAQGEASAQAAMGEAYLRGNGVPMDLDLAEAWSRKGAEQGNPVAIKNLEFIPRHRRALSGEGYKDTLDLLNRMLTDFAKRERVKEEYWAGQQPDWNDPAAAQCRARTEPNIAECTSYQDTGNCDLQGCPDVVDCVGGANCTLHTRGPYGEYGDFFCDDRNIRNIDVDREVVFRDACNGRFGQ